MTKNALNVKNNSFCIIIHVSPSVLMDFMDLKEFVNLVVKIVLYVMDQPAKNVQSISFWSIINV